jgi:RimJ/RimL family protein N-acetyltransferase
MERRLERYAAVGCGAVATAPRSETERLILRPYAEADFDALLAMQSRADVARWLYWEARDPEAVRTALAKKLGETALAGDGGCISLAAELKDSSEVIGDCTLWRVSAEHRLGEIGFVFHPDHHGRGYATEAGRELLRLAFAEHGFHRVIGRLEVRNAASARVLERLGMRREAHLVENEWVKDEWQSELVYAILEHEWRAQTRA